MKKYIAIGHWGGNDNTTSVAGDAYTLKDFRHDLIANDFKAWAVLTEKRFAEVKDLSGFELWDEVSRMVNNYRKADEVADYIEQCADLMEEKLEAIESEDDEPAAEPKQHVAMAVTTFSDAYNRPTELRPEELRWFEAVVAQARRATGVEVEIVPYDHELYTGKHRDALGTCTTKNPENPLAPDADSYITIDCYFIDEKYRERFEGAYTIEKQTLEEVIAHEIAHLYVWRHGKKHDRLTAELYERIKAAA